MIFIQSYGMNFMSTKSLALSRLGVRSQTVVPKEVRQALGLAPGDRVGFLIENGRVELIKLSARGDDPFATFREWGSDADSQGYAGL